MIYDLSLENLLFWFDTVISRENWSFTFRVFLEFDVFYFWKIDELFKDVNKHLVTMPENSPNFSFDLERIIKSLLKSSAIKASNLTILKTFSLLSVCFLFESLNFSTRSDLSTFGNVKKQFWIFWWQKMCKMALFTTIMVTFFEMKSWSTFKSPRQISCTAKCCEIKLDISSGF